MHKTGKILTVIGARPQFIKASVVSRALSSFENLREVIVHTGQHFSEAMSDIFFDELRIPRPAFNLGIDSLSHGAMTGRMLEAIENVLKAEAPDFVVVYGDTNSTLAGALAAAKLNIPVAHVEAGLRSFDMRMPEEINRILTDRISTLLFCPTRTAVKNLEFEGFADFPAQIIETGDVMLDAIQSHRSLARLPDNTATRLPAHLKDFVLATIHRAENTDDLKRLLGILSALEEIHRSVPVLLLLHPRTRKILVANRIEPKICVADPVGYLEMIFLLDRCRLVMTDSGGLQKEAFFMGKYCLTLRDNTEWTELIEAGVNLLVGTEPESILSGFQACLTQRYDPKISPYGDGHAGERIADRIADFMQI